MISRNVFCSARHIKIVTLKRVTLPSNGSHGLSNTFTEHNIKEDVAKKQLQEVWGRQHMRAQQNIRRICFCSAREHRGKAGRGHVTATKIQTLAVSKLTGACARRWFTLVVRRPESPCPESADVLATVAAKAAVLSPRQSLQAVRELRGRLGSAIVPTQMHAAFVQELSGSNQADRLARLLGRLGSRRR